jgi:hypothetical protein
VCVYSERKEGLSNDVPHNQANKSQLGWDIFTKYEIILISIFEMIMADYELFNKVVVMRIY